MFSIIVKKVPASHENGGMKCCMSEECTSAFCERRCRKGAVNGEHSPASLRSNCQERRLSDECTPVSFVSSRRKACGKNTPARKGWTTVATRLAHVDPARSAVSDPVETPSKVGRTRNVDDGSKRRTSKSKWFHHGRRATKILSEQKSLKKDPEEKEFVADAAHQSKVAKAFDVLASASHFCHLHQQAGWIDIDSVAVWDSYVKDVMDGKLRDGDRLFEAGCGVLAFLRSAEKLAKDIAIGGLDGAPKTIQLIKEQFLSAADADNFFVGFLPDALTACASNSWDIVVCNSVFQYFDNAAQAEKTVNEMIRVAKRWIIIADVLDEKYSELQHRHALTLGSTAGVNLPKYLGYSRSWWEQFENDNHLVSIRKVESKTYVRRKERYTVYIEKNAEVIAAEENAD